MVRTLILESADGTTFEVESFYLQAASKVFRDMLDDNQLSASSEPIVIDAGADIVGIVVEWIKNEEAKERIKADQVKSLIEVWKKYELEVVRRRLITSLIADILSPWPTMVAAAALDSEDLAKQAISQFNAFPFRGELKGFPSAAHAAELGTRYTLALARACISAAVDAVGTNSSHGIQKTIARRFKLE